MSDHINGSPLHLLPQAYFPNFNGCAHKLVSCGVPPCRGCTSYSLCVCYQLSSLTKIKFDNNLWRFQNVLGVDWAAPPCCPSPSWPSSSWASSSSSYYWNSMGYSLVSFPLISLQAWAMEFLGSTSSLWPQGVFMSCFWDFVKRMSCGEGYL